MFNKILKYAVSLNKTSKRTNSNRKNSYFNE